MNCKLGGVFMALFAGGFLPAPAHADDDYVACQQTADLEKSVLACDRLINDQNETVQNRAVFHLYRGSALLAKGDLTRAVADFSQTINFDPQNVYAYLNRATANLRMHNRNEAIADYQKAVRLAPTLVSRAMSDNEELQSLQNGATKSDAPATATRASNEGSRSVDLQNPPGGFTKGGRPILSFAGPGEPDAGNRDLRPDTTASGRRILSFGERHNDETRSASNAVGNSEPGAAVKLTRAQIGAALQVGGCDTFFSQPNSDAMTAAVVYSADAQDSRAEALRRIQAIGLTTIQDISYPVKWNFKMFNPYIAQLQSNRPFIVLICGERGGFEQQMDYKAKGSFSYTSG